ncbi:hypothetical protein DFJ74DRAFT_674843 [Hyaloraphidium curvatum]|nr:hypothetical protein DFJ74DRAFT_674843 [Hyaloraphidium curvatum]
MLGVTFISTTLGSAVGRYVKLVLTARVERAPTAAGPAAESTRVVLTLRVTVVAAPMLGVRSTLLRPRIILVRRAS